MNAEMIFQPMLAMMVLTAVVWFWLYARRIPAMYRVGKQAQTYTTPDAVEKNLPEKANYPAYYLRNLFEMPVLFYVLCLYLYVIDDVDMIYTVAAWLFVVFRAAHSVVHCTSNIVMLRFRLYAVAALILWAMLARAIINAV